MNNRNPDLEQEEQERREQELREEQERAASLRDELQSSGARGFDPGDEGKDPVIINK